MGKLLEVKMLVVVMLLSEVCGCGCEALDEQLCNRYCSNKHTHLDRADALTAASLHAEAERRPAELSLLAETQTHQQTDRQTDRHTESGANAATMPEAKIPKSQRPTVVHLCCKVTGY